LENTVLQWVATYGYFAIFSLLVLGIVGLPVPDEFLLASCGFLVFKGDLQLVPTLLSALAGSTCGITLSYTIGRTVGWKFLHSRWGRFLHVKDEHIERVHHWFDKIGHWALMVGYFIPGVPSARTLRAMVKAYKRSRRELRPVLDIILRHPRMYARLNDPDLVKPPVVYVAGMLRALHVPVDDDSWTYILDEMGQRPFYPPNVGGWPSNDAWLSTNTLRARWDAVNNIIGRHGYDLDDDRMPKSGEPPAKSLAWARKATGHPFESPATRTRMNHVAGSIRPRASYEVQHTVAERRRVIRLFLLLGPDALVH